LLLAQESNTITLSFKECMQMAVEKNVNVKSARIDKEKSGYKKDEARAAFLPKLNFSGSFQDNVFLPTTVLPGEFLGKPGTTIPVQMGSQYNTTATVSLSQILYNQTAMIAIKLSTKSSELSSLTVEKICEEIAAEVGKLYFLTLTVDPTDRYGHTGYCRSAKCGRKCGVVFASSESRPGVYGHSSG